MSKREPQGGSPVDSISPQELERLVAVLARTNLVHSDIIAIQSALRAYAALRARESAIEEAFSDAVMHIVGPELHVRVWEEYANQLSLIPTDQQSTDALSAQEQRVAGLTEALKQILGWRELRSGANEIPIGRIEDIARAALAEQPPKGGI